MDKQALHKQQQLILDLIREFCAKKLDEEYFVLAERLTAKLGRKRNSPLKTGRPEIWAAAIIHALGTINFLFDKSFEPSITIDELNAFFHTSKSTTGSKSKYIRELLQLRTWDHAFSTRKMRDSNPLNNLVMVDEGIVPLATLPEEYQELVRKARAEGKDISFKTR